MRLKQDAGEITADVPQGFRSRIQAALEAQAPARRPVRKTISYRLWLAASLSGAAAAVLVLTLIPRDANPPLPTNERVARTVPEYVHGVEREFPLQVKTAELTAPLEEELAKLQSDMEKARARVEEDLDFSF
jgi:hypothetical protein